MPDKTERVSQLKYRTLDELDILHCSLQAAFSYSILFLMNDYNKRYSSVQDNDLECYNVAMLIQEDVMQTHAEESQ